MGTVSCDNFSIAGSDISNDSVTIGIAGSDMSNKSSTIVRSSGITNQLNRKELLKEKARLRMAKKRLDIEYRAKERILDKNRKRECRLDEEYRANEREKMKKRRLDEEYSANEREKMKKRRLD